MVAADLILSDAKVFRYGQPLAEGQAVVVKFGKILAVGPSQKIGGLAGNQTRVIELGGRVLIPGFCDSHLHLASFGQSLRRIDLAGSKTLEEALQRIRHALPRFEKETWIMGRGWDKNLWGEQFPNRQQLDSVVADKPAAFSSRCGHIMWANSAALAIAAITHETPDPADGEIERDETGEPTGILKEGAIRLIKDVRPEPDIAATKEGILDAVKEAHRLGVTSVVTLAGRTELSALTELERERRLPLRVSAYSEDPEEFLESCVKNGGLRLPLVGERLSLMGLKLYVDGSLGGQTAFMFKPYEASESCGIPVVCGDRLKEIVLQSSRFGVPCAIHAIGDRAVAEALDAFEVSREVNSDTRHRVEHTQLMRKQDIERFARGGFIASMQPVHLYGDRETAERYWGGRCRYAYPLRSLLKSGARVALGTDTPIERLNPMLGLFAACAREPEDGGAPWYAGERIDLPTAVNCYTAEGAYATYAENRRGSIAPGMDADLVVLRRDFFDMKPRELLSTEVELTVFGGAVVHQALR
jgi:predicted amidohydrolase YtcJ